MSAPIGSLSELKELLKGKKGKQSVFEKRKFPFYSVLIYSHIKGLNSHLHNYVMNNFELFNEQTGPNWLVAVLEDLQDMKRKDFKPQDVYKIARYLKVRVDEIPAIVFFTEPNKRRDLYILNLSDIIYESEEYDEESINFIFSKMAAIIDDICEIDQGRTDRMEVLQAKFNREFKRINGDVENYGKVLELLRKTSITAKNVFSAIGEAVQTYNSILGIMA